MDKLLKKLKDWHLSHDKPVYMTKWFRDVLYTHIITTIKESEAQPYKMNKRKFKL